MPEAPSISQPSQTDQQRIETIRRLMEDVEAARQRYELLALRLRLVCVEARGHDS